MFGTAIYNGENVLIFDRLIKKYLISWDVCKWVDESELENIKLLKNNPDDITFF